MTLTSTQFITVRHDGIDRDIAWRQTAAQPGDSRPALFWLNGFTSTMQSTKITALAAWCEARGVGLTCFDYMGHGESGGDFASGSISQWLADAEAVFGQTTQGRQILIGSSMGGWIALLLLRRHLATLAPQDSSRMAGLILIAPALDLTEDLIWQQLDDNARARLRAEGMLMRPDRHGGPPTAISLAFVEDGRHHLLAGTGLRPGCPVRILQGMNDDVVPWQHALRTLDSLVEDDCELQFVRDGDHRLSRPQDIRRLLRMVEDLIETVS